MLLKKLIIHLKTWRKTLQKEDENRLKFYTAESKEGDWGIAINLD